MNETSDTEQNREVTVRERLCNAVREHAQTLTCAYNDIFTLKMWQLIVNFAIGICALALLIASMISQNELFKVFGSIGGIAAVIAVVIFYFVMRARKPMSYLQYSYKTKDKTYRFQIIGKNRALYSDGETVVDVNNGEIKRDGELVMPFLRFDFFADMDVDMRIGKAETETFSGTVDVDGTRTKCKIVFKNGAPFKGSVGGMRIKYFDVNDTKEKFGVPDFLRRAMAQCEIAMPKIQGIK